MKTIRTQPILANNSSSEIYWIFFIFNVRDTGTNNWMKSFSFLQRIRLVKPIVYFVTCFKLQIGSQQVLLLNDSDYCPLTLYFSVRQKKLQRKLWRNALYLFIFFSFFFLAMLFQLAIDPEFSLIFDPRIQTNLKLIINIRQLENFHLYKVALFSICYIAIFQTMNILQEQDKHTEELRNCKMMFLRNQNDWMTKQKDFINNIIYKYKQVIELSEKAQKEEDISNLKANIGKLVEEKIRQYQALKSTQYFGEEDMTNEQFMDIIQSFQNKILKLQQDIKNRQNQLQELEDKKVKEDSGKIRRNQSKWLNNIQTNKKLIQKVRTEVTHLKDKKKRLQTKILALAQNKCEDSEPTQPLNRVEKENEMSTFEKALLVFKKKKYQNDVLEQRIKQLQNRIAVKKQISQKMKKEADNLEWKCLQSLETGGNGYIETNSQYDMSLVDKSFSRNSMSFSFDVSRFIKPKQQIGQL